MRNVKSVVLLLAIMATIGLSGCAKDSEKAAGEGLAEQLCAKIGNCPTTIHTNVSQCVEHWKGIQTGQVECAITCADAASTCDGWIACFNASCAK